MGRTTGHPGGTTEPRGIIAYMEHPSSPTWLYRDSRDTITMEECNPPRISLAHDSQRGASVFHADPRTSNPPRGGNGGGRDQGWWLRLSRSKTGRLRAARLS